MSFQEKILNLEPVNLFEYKDQFPEFVELENTPQSKKWHSEGNVLIHTDMVMEKAREIAVQMENKDDGISTYLGGLLHDFGKPETTVVSADGKCPAHGHEGVGVWKAREFLRKHFPMFGYARREWILSLVEYHGHPKRMAKDGSDDLRFKRLSLEVNTEQVYHVEVADFTGRIGESAETALGYLDSFKQRCIDLGIWDTYYELPNNKGIPQHAYNLARWKVLFGNMKETDEKKMAECVRLMSKPPFELMILVGAPGSGKTTHVKTLYPHVPYISMDEERLKLCGTMMDMSRNQEAYDNCFHQLRKNMEHRINTIWDATSVSRRLRKRLIETARHHGAWVSIVVFDLPLDIIQARNAGRERIVPADIVEDYFKKIQSPKPYEYDRLLVIDEKTKYDAPIQAA
jgi:predicted kinase